VRGKGSDLDDSQAFFMNKSFMDVNRERQKNDPYEKEKELQFDRRGAGGKGQGARNMCWWAEEQRGAVFLVVNQQKTLKGREKGLGASTGGSMGEVFAPRGGGEWNRGGASREGDMTRGKTAGGGGGDKGTKSYYDQRGGGGRRSEHRGAAGASYRGREKRRVGERAKLK